MISPAPRAENPRIVAEDNLAFERYPQRGNEPLGDSGKRTYAGAYDGGDQYGDDGVHS